MLDASKRALAGREGARECIDTEWQLARLQYVDAFGGTDAWHDGVQVQFAPQDALQHSLCPRLRDGTCSTGNPAGSGNIYAMP